MEQSRDPVLSGYVAESQTSPGASSTRQELLAQLGIEYWLQYLANKLGEQLVKVSIQLVTDSQASIQILETFTSSIGIKAFLQPDRDKTMEIEAQHKLSTHCSTETFKVGSHISMEESPDKLFWKVNDESDKLATTAREQVLLATMAAKQPTFLPGSRAACCINRVVFCTNDMKESIHTGIYSRALKEFLCTKYDWLEQDFHQVDWEAHKGVLTQFLSLRRITVTSICAWLVSKPKTKVQRRSLLHPTLYAMQQGRGQQPYILLHSYNNTRAPV